MAMIRFAKSVLKCKYFSPLVILPRVNNHTSCIYIKCDVALPIMTINFMAAVQLLWA